MYKRIKSLNNKNFFEKMTCLRGKKHPLPQKLIYTLCIAALIAADAGTTLSVHAKVSDDELESQLIDFYCNVNNVIVFPTAEISMVSLSEESVSALDSINNFGADEASAATEAVSDEEFELLGNVENICYDIYSGDDFVSYEISNDASTVVQDALTSIDEAISGLDAIAEAEAKAKAAEEAAKWAASYVDNPNMVIKLTNEELDLLERLVQCEAGGEDTIGKILVANVIINRVNSKSFPNNVSSVINASGQFSPVTSGLVDKTTATSATKKAVARALSGEDYSDGALFFIARKHCSKSSASWFDNHLTKVVEHGGHEFFK